MAWIVCTYLPVELSLWSDTCDSPTAQNKDTVKHGPLGVGGWGRGVDFLSAGEPLGPGVAGQANVELHRATVVHTGERRSE